MIELFKLNRYSCALKQDAMESNERVLGKIIYLSLCDIWDTLIHGNPCIPEEY